MAALTLKAVPSIPEEADPHPTAGRILTRTMQVAVSIMGALNAPLLVRLLLIAMCSHC